MGKSSQLTQDQIDAIKDLTDYAAKRTGAPKSAARVDPLTLQMLKMAYEQASQPMAPPIVTPTVYPSMRRVGLIAEITLPANTTAKCVFRLAAIPGFKKVDDYNCTIPFRHWAQAKAVLEGEFGKVEWSLLDEPKVDPHAPLELFVEYIGGCRTRVDRSRNVFGQKLGICQACGGTGLNGNPLFGSRSTSFSCPTCKGAGSVATPDTVEPFATAWVDGGWHVRFPESVLRKFFPEPSKPFDGDFYKALLSGRDLSKAYKQLARQFHPDLNKNKNAAAQFRKLREAYDALSDPMRRKRYEAGLKFQTQAIERPAAGSLVFRVPKTCGRVVVRGVWEEIQLDHRLRFVDDKGNESSCYRRLAVTEILRWDDVFDSKGRIMVSTWNRTLPATDDDDPFGSDGRKPFTVTWESTQEFDIRV